MSFLRNAMMGAMPALVLALAACGGEKQEAPKVDTPPALESVESEIVGAPDKSAPTIEELIERREKNFKKIGKSFKTINDSIKAGDATSQASLDAIKVVGKLAPKIGNWFPEGTGPESGFKTEAKAVIWTDSEDFGVKITEFQAAIAALVLAGESGDAAAVTAAFGAAGKTCKSCHDVYREKHKD